jgi:hypothetical protein
MADTKTRLDLIYQVLDNLGVTVRRRATISAAEPEATKTRLQLIYQVLDNLGVLVQGQAPDAEIVDRIDDLLDASLATLAELDIIAVASPGTANPAAGGAFVASTFMPLAAIIANRAAPAFNMAGDASLMALSKLAENDLRAMSRLTRVDAFIDPALAMLSSLDIAVIGDAGEPVGTGGEIEPDVFLPIAAIVANHAAPIAGRGGDQTLAALAAMAESTLRTMGRPARTRKLLTTDRQLRSGNRAAVFNFTTGR